MSSRIPETDVRSPRVRAGVAYWNEKRGANLLPARADFDPLIEVPGLAPHMMLKDVQREPLDFRYRLVGTLVRNHLRHDPTGQWMTNIPGQGPGNQLWAYHEHVVNTRAPLFLRPDYVGPHKEFLAIESVILPLASDHETVDMLMIFVDFLRAAGK
jgi:hypothetical protein